MMTSRPSVPMTYVKVTDEDEAGDPIELPIDGDGTLSMRTVVSQFDGAIGLKYWNPETGTYRGLKLDRQGRLFPPSEGWGNLIFSVAFPKGFKRNIHEKVAPVSAPTKPKVVEQEECSDLVVLGVNNEISDSTFREYFEQFGQVVKSLVKRRLETGETLGYGFIRFADHDSEQKAMGCHTIGGQPCMVERQKQGREEMQYNGRVIVTRLTKDVTRNDLVDYFSKFGKITNVFISPRKPNVAFFSFHDPNIAKRICNKEHTIGQCNAWVAHARPRKAFDRFSSSMHDIHALFGYGKRPRSPSHELGRGPVPPKPKHNRYGGFSSSSSSVVYVDFSFNSDPNGLSSASMQPSTSTGIFHSSGTASRGNYALNPGINNFWNSALYAAVKDALLKSMGKPRPSPPDTSGTSSGRGEPGGSN